jgi:hypothetical protein
MGDAIYQGIKRYFARNPPVARARFAAERPAHAVD